MKQLGLLAAGVAVVWLGTATAQAQTLPGFPHVRTNTQLLELLDADKKPLLKVVGGDYDTEKRTITWLVELQADIGFFETVVIGPAWRRLWSIEFPLQITQGPSASFFDKDKVAVFTQKTTVVGRLVGGKKGDRVKVVLYLDELPPGTTSVDFRQGR